MEKALERYASVLAVEERRRGNTLTPTDLEQAMRLQYRIVKGRKEKISNRELLLTEFDVRCYQCNKVRHRANKCRANKRHDRNTGPTLTLKYMIILSMHSFNLFFSSFLTLYIIYPSSQHTHKTFHYID